MTTKKKEKSVSDLLKERKEKKLCKNWKRGKNMKIV